MKKIFAIATFVMGIITSRAQTVPAVGRVTFTDSLVNTDTSALTAAQIGSNVKGFQITALKASGTVSGKIYLRGTVDGLAWVNIDSLTLADVATYQTKIVIPAHTSYASYGTYVTSSGTQKYYLYFTPLRRQDELY